MFDEQPEVRAESPRERSRRNRRDYDDEPRRDCETRDYGGAPEEEPRARQRGSRRDYDDDYEPQPRERRREPSASEPQEQRERREPRERAQRSPRDAEERTGERRPAPILPSWEEASSYVVNFNLSRRNRRGRNK